MTILANHRGNTVGWGPGSKALPENPPGALSQASGDNCCCSPPSASASRPVLSWQLNSLGQKQSKSPCVGERDQKGLEVHSDPHKEIRLATVYVSTSIFRSIFILVAY